MHLGAGKKRGGVRHETFVAQGGLQRGEGKGGVGTAVAPVTRALGVNASWLVGLETVPVGLREQGEGGAGGVRLILGDGQGAEGEAAEADLVPIIITGMPPIETRVGIEARADAFFKNGGPQGGAGSGRQIGVEPIVTEGECGGHLGNV